MSAMYGSIAVAFLALAFWPQLLLAGGRPDIDPTFRDSNFPFGVVDSSCRSPLLLLCTFACVRLVALSCLDPETGTAQELNCCFVPVGQPAVLACDVHPASRGGD